MLLYYIYKHINHSYWSYIFTNLAILHILHGKPPLPSGRCENVCNVSCSRSRPGGMGFNHPKLGDF